MNGDKFDKRLLTEIDAAVGRGEASGLTLAEVGETERIPVTITSPELLERRKYRDRDRMMTSYDGQFDRSQRAVLKFLEGIGAGKVDKLLLSNSISVELTVTQLQKLDEERELLNEIDLVRLVKQDDVACLHHSAQVIEARPYVWDGLGATGKGVKLAKLLSFIGIIIGFTMVGGENSDAGAFILLASCVAFVVSVVTKWWKYE